MQPDTGGAVANAWLGIDNLFSPALPCWPLVRFLPGWPPFLPQRQPALLPLPLRWPLPEPWPTPPLRLLSSPPPRQTPPALSNRRVCFHRQQLPCILRSFASRKTLSKVRRRCRAQKKQLASLSYGQRSIISGKSCVGRRLPRNGSQTLLELGIEN